MRTTLAVQTIFAAGVLALASCGGGTPVELRTLTEPDVVGMTSGNATGTTFAGTYVVDAGGIDGCRCRTGSCGLFHTSIGAAATVEQQDGALTIRGCTGGVNEDGTFWCGGAQNVPGDIEVTLETGKFTAAAGKPSRLDFESETTLVATVNGAAVDCDLKTHGSARFVGP